MELRVLGWESTQRESGYFLSLYKLEINLHKSFPAWSLASSHSNSTNGYSLHGSHRWLKRCFWILATLSCANVNSQNSIASMLGTRIYLNSWASLIHVYASHFIFSASHKESSFDVVLSGLVPGSLTQHSAELLAEIARIVKPGGRVLLKEAVTPEASKSLIFR